MEILSLPLFNGTATSALNAYPRTRPVGDWSAALNSLTAVAQQAIAAQLRNVGVPLGLIQTGQAIAYQAQGYQFQGGTVTLRSGVSGTPMTAPNGQRLLLTTEGAAIPYTSADIGSASGTNANNRSSDNLVLWVGLGVAAIWFLARRK